jgi:hypothetical protein
MTPQRQPLKCFDCGAPVIDGGVIQHEPSCDGSPHCGCETTVYCNSCKRLARARGNTLLAEAIGNTWTTPMNRAARRRAFREIARARREADDD